MAVASAVSGMGLVQLWSGEEPLMVVTVSWGRIGSCPQLTPAKRKIMAKERGRKCCHIRLAGQEEAGSSSPS